MDYVSRSTGNWVPKRPSKVFRAESCAVLNDSNPAAVCAWGWGRSPSPVRGDESLDIFHTWDGQKAALS